MVLMITLFFVALFAVSVWAVKLSAGWLKAGHSGWGRAAIGVLITTVINTAAGAIGLNPWLVLMLNILISTGVFTWILATTPVRGLGITVISTVITTVFAVIIVLMLTALGIGGDLMKVLGELDGGMNADGEPSMTIEQAVDRVCECGNDPQCLQQRYAEVIFMGAQMEDDLSTDPTRHLEKARRCVSLGKQGRLGARVPDEHESQTTAEQEPPAAQSPVEPATTTAATGDAPVAAEPVDPDTTAAPSTQPTGVSITGQDPYGQQASRQRKRFAGAQNYQPIAVHQAGDYMHQVVRITRSDNGRVVEGTLTPAQDRYTKNTITLTQNRFGGTMIMQVPFDKIRRIEVRTQSRR